MNRQETGQAPLQDCDLVMKGGIASGVVYPRAVLRLKDKHRFRSIGGASAGAIAAAVTAAAEYARQTGRDKDGAGFAAVAQISEDIAQELFGLFQPMPKTRPLFALFLASVRGDSVWGMARTAVWAGLKAWPARAVVGAFIGGVCAFVALTLLGLAFGAVSPVWRGAPEWAPAMALTLAAGMLGGAAAALAQGYRIALTKDLPQQDFGLCSGLRQPGGRGPALTEWLHARIQAAAGLPEDQPLTCGMLRGGGAAPMIDFAAITTNLSKRRPYRLPLAYAPVRPDADARASGERYYFRKSEFARLFPAAVTAAMTRGAAPLADALDENGRPIADLYPFPEPEDQPLVALARMSLSFPFLIAAAPLYATDPIRGDDKAGRFYRQLFSDGGLSSNFPVHFFDSPFPSRPTFGIALGENHGPRNAAAFRAAADPEGAPVAFMPKQDDLGGAAFPASLPLRPIGEMGQFFMALFNSAKDWRDNLQNTLPGYRDRTVEILLTDAEGGLNLAMPPEVVRRLLGYGESAAGLFEGFDFTRHAATRAIHALVAEEGAMRRFGPAMAAETESGARLREAVLKAFEAMPPEVGGGGRKDGFAPEDAAAASLAARRLLDIEALSKRWAADGAQLGALETPRPRPDLSFIARE